jgi:hypothetical protein
MKRLKQLHDEVKNHPYRINKEERYRKSYQDLLNELSSEFWKEVRETEYHGASNMCHDFYYCIRWLHADRNEDILHIERCLSTIHDFIDTGRVDTFYVYYNGVNTHNLPRLSKHIYCPIDKVYRVKYSEEEFNKGISFLTEMCEDVKIKPFYEIYLTRLIENRNYWYKNERTG